jgi:hypothetical protein
MDMAVKLSELATTTRVQKKQSDGLVYPIDSFLHLFLLSKHLIPSTYHVAMAGSGRDRLDGHLVITLTMAQEERKGPSLQRP